MNIGKNIKNKTTRLYHDYTVFIEQAQYGWIRKSGFPYIIRLRINGVIGCRSEIHTVKIGPFKNSLMQITSLKTGIGLIGFTKIGFPDRAIQKKCFLQILFQKE